LVGLLLSLAPPEEPEPVKPVFQASLAPGSFLKERKKTAPCFRQNIPYKPELFWEEKPSQTGP
jgi:patatin-like phospholipase/acyl hydrolase